MSSYLWTVVRQARLTRVLVVYLGVSFAAIEAVDIFTEQFGLPDWVFPGTIVLLIVGFPLVVATALLQGFATRTAQARRGEPSGVAESGARPITAAAATTEPPGESEPRAATEPVTERLAPVVAPLSDEVGRPWLSWRKAIIGLVFAFAAWGLVVAGYMTMRGLGIGPVGSLVAAGVLDARDRIVLADFENNTNDPLLGRAVTEAFRIDLEQSTLVTVADRAVLDQALARMQRAQNEALDLRLAREIAIREGMTAVIAGEVSTIGASYVLSTELVSAGNGEVLAAYRETAADSTAIIGAIDRLSKKLRERIGESLRTIRRNEPLDQVTTPSLQALRKYSQALRALQMADNQRAIALLEEAVAIDTAFAMAYRKLGVTLNNSQRDPTRATEAITAAYEHRDRLTERERYLTLGTYYTSVTKETVKAINAFRTLLESHPNDTWALNNLALQYMELRDYAGADELLTRSIQLDSTSALQYGNAITAQVAQGNFGSAEVTLTRFAANAPGHPQVPMWSSMLASARFDYETAEAHLSVFDERYRGDPTWLVGAMMQQAQLAEVQGQLGKAERYIRRVMAGAAEQGQTGLALTLALRLGFYDLIYRGSPARALAQIESALQEYPLASIPPRERPYVLLAMLYALSGEIERARAMIAEYEAEVEPSDRDEDLARVAAGVLALAEERSTEAIGVLRRADEGACPICVNPLLGQAYDEAQEPDSVIAIYERYLSTPWLFRLTVSDWYALGGIYERLAFLYEERGEPANAARYYSRLIELWKDADPEIQPRVEAARRALRDLTPDRPVAG